MKMKIKNEIGNANELRTFFTIVAHKMEMEITNQNIFKKVALPDYRIDQKRSKAVQKRLEAS